MMTKIDELSPDVQELQRRGGIGKHFWKDTGDQLLAATFGASTALILAIIGFALFLLWYWL